MNTPEIATLAMLTYHSGQFNPSAVFTVSEAGYRVIYVCDALPDLLDKGLVDPLYQLTGEKTATVIKHMKCDGERHSEEYHPKVDPDYDQRTVAFVGDNMGVTSMALRVEALSSDSS